MATTGHKHAWEFTRYFRAGIYRWNGTALAAKRITGAVREIQAVAKKDPLLAAHGAVKFFEKCWRAIEHIDSSSGAIGNAVNNAVVALTDLLAQARIPSATRLKMTDAIWESWQEEDYGYYDLFCELWPRLCVDPVIMNYWADEFLPVVKTIFSTTGHHAYFKGTEPCLACLFETGRYDEIVALFQIREQRSFSYQKYLIKVTAARGELDRALSMIDIAHKDQNSSWQAARLGEELLQRAGRDNEAYTRYGLTIPFQTTGLATLSAIRTRHPKISPQRIINDLIEADPGNERRYFAAARKVGMIELATEIAEKYDVEPKTLTTACKDYLETDPERALKFGLLALQKYADGSGYEPEYGDIQRCHEYVCMASERAGKKDETARKIAALLQGDRSTRKLVSLVLNRQAVMSLLHRPDTQPHP